MKLLFSLLKKGSVLDQILSPKAVPEFDTFKSIKEFLIEPDYSEFVDDSGEFSWSGF